MIYIIDIYTFTLYYTYYIEWHNIMYVCIYIHI